MQEKEPERKEDGDRAAETADVQEPRGAIVTREAWLLSLAAEVAAWFTLLDYALPDYRISCGWPSSSALSRKRRRMGECWNRGASSSGHREIFISPLLDDPVDVAQVVVHELIHAALPEGAGHGWAFRRAMRALHLEGKPTATVAGEAFRREIAPVLCRLGPYPHSAMTAPLRGRTDGTRMIKVWCTACGYTARVARKWLNAVGAPLCPCSSCPMAVEA